MDGTGGSTAIRTPDHAPAGKLPAASIKSEMTRHYGTIRPSVASGVEELRTKLTVQRYDWIELALACGRVPPPGGGGFAGAGLSRILTGEHQTG